MKNLYLILLSLIGFSASSQIINVPDANFKNALLNPTFGTIDTNGDGEIQISEAHAVTGMNVDNKNINSLAGIEYFINLTYLGCSGNNLVSVDFSALTHLGLLEILGNQLIALDLSNCTELNQVECNGNALTSLVLPTTLPNPLSLSCSNNQLTSLNFGSLVLSDLFCSNNNLTSLDLSNAELSELDVSNNQLTSLDIAGGVYLYNVNVSGNPLQTLSMSIPDLLDFDCSNTALTALDMTQVHFMTYEWGYVAINDNPNLQYINFKNGAYNGCINSGEGDGCVSYYIHNNPSLQFVCVDSAAEASYLDSITDTNNVTFTNYCTFTPGGGFNTVSGTITYDCGASNINLSNIAVQAITGNAQTTFSNAAGLYSFYTGLGSNTAIVSLEHPAYFTVTPSQFDYNFTNAGNTVNADFCISANGVHPDLELTMIPLTAARPGFNATYQLVCKNNGTEIQSGTITLNFNDSILDFISAVPAIASQTTGSLIWNFSALHPLQQTVITFTLNLNSPTENPAVNQGDILLFNASTPWTGDATPQDNLAELNQTVTGSFDPNDKAVNEDLIYLMTIGGLQSLAQNQSPNDYLHYTVRFQNTGTSNAENVVLQDMLSAKLDLSTLEMVSSSHPYRSTLTQGNKLEFFFDGINLPAAAANEAGSHGYVSFKIKPIEALAYGDIIENTANIYFDFNAPVVTNTVTTTVTVLGLNSNEIRNFSMYPNPAKSIVEITSDENLNSVTVYNLLGQKVLSRINTGSHATVDISALHSGTYLIEVRSDRGKMIKKLIKI